MNNIQIDTKCGKIIGIDNGDTVEYRGIKYADAKRWEYPDQVTGWEGVYDATYFKECSYQRRGFEDDEVCNAFYHKEFRRGQTFTYSEDCQFLNIWAPKNAENCPVLIYIHGGSFTGGSDDEAHLNATAFARNGIVVVGMNYRLGPYGFCSHPELKNQNGICGNFGLYDQYVAIKWVKDNISSFGGNSEKITLMGQSAGAMSVDIQLNNPMCKGWFKGAILMSGAGIQRKIARPLAPEKTEGFWNSIIQKANVKTMAELREVDEKTLYYAWFDACKENKLSALYTLPVCDGKIVTKSGFNMDSIPDIPYIIGITTEDMVPAVLEMLVKSWGRKTQKNKSNTYFYIFSRALPGDNKGAWHACDLPYAFSTLDCSWRPFEKTDYDISNQMLKSICAFAETGSPDCDAIPEWTAGLKAPMRFCESTAPTGWETGKLIKSTLFKRG